MTDRIWRSRFRRDRLSVIALLVAVAFGPPGGAQGGPSVTLTHVAGSTGKLEQLVGDFDKQRKSQTRGRTASRFGVDGTDLGNSFEHDGRVYFLFGDTLGTLASALDTIATTTATDPEQGVALDFLMAPSPARAGRGRARGRGRPDASRPTYLTIQPDGISMGAFEVPVAGLSHRGQMYVVLSTDHSNERATDRSILTKFKPPSTFEPIRTISRLPEGRFVKGSLRMQPASAAGFPPGGPFVAMFGTGRYRASDAYLSLVPAARFESGDGTRYFAGLDSNGSPRWSERESDSAAIVRHGGLGDLSVTWCEPLKLWLMTYDSRPPRRGILFSYAATPWGPWSEPQVIFNGEPEPGFGPFIHNPRAVPADGLAGPVIGPGARNPEAVPGGAYAPYMIERWTKVRGSELTIYYVLSTWNPYVVVLMRSSFRVS